MARRSRRQAKLKSTPGSLICLLEKRSINTLTEWMQINAVVALSSIKGS